MLKAVFFDLDGTLLPMNEEMFIKVYFQKLYEKIKDRGYSFDELYKTIWEGTIAMYKNDGTSTNDKIFWKVFVNHFGNKCLEDKALFDDFYLNEFKQIKSICKENPLAKESVKYAKEKTGISVLATNPVFPYDGTKTRMGFVNLDPEDFDFMTSYENSSFCKPNPAYFVMLMNKFNLKPEEVIMFGNNDKEDYNCALQAGIKCYLIDTGFLILHEEIKKDYEIIKMEDVISVIDKEYELRK